MITADSFFTDSFNLEVLNTTSIFSITGNLTVDCDLTTNGIIYTDTISSQTGATGTIGIIGDLQAIKLKSDYIEVSNNISCLNCSADYTLNCITLQADYVNVSSLGNISTNAITSPLGNLTITSGKLTANGGIDTSGTITTYDLTVNNVIKTSKIQPPSLISQIEFFKDSTLPIFFTKFKFQNTDITSTAISDTVNLFTNLPSGAVNMCSNLIFKASSITSSGVDDLINLFTNLTTGTLNLATGITTGILNIGTGITTGDIFIGNTTGTTAGALGDITMGNGSNNNNTAGNGTVTINKLQIGTGPIIRNVRFGSVAGGSTSAVVSFSPAFPSGQVPYIVGNIQSSSTTQVFSLVFSSVGISSFRYTKIQTAENKAAHNKAQST
jgi:hypothetical protein